ncbi:PIG-L family deacetylase [Acidisoma cellulosilytica]|uniref:PIG-L family deacetylase n=1 Tax=Acidisoma cellulosilyticum TaxID=2802395 RepID=A0A963Z6A7_9PROT|nr:PIG-L deacetylase family protein [Acidisoma cellulosilyticum]MCB8883654.1 PIG-L family deacetylase [Acidisoma cellulosilyticum]
MLMREVRAAWEKLPLVDLETLLGGRTPLILAPHPDDESLGCGGFLAQCAAAAIPTQVAILTDGSRSHPGSVTYPPSRLAAVRKQEALKALMVLGLPENSLCWIGAEDSSLPLSGQEAENILARLTDLCDRTGCNLVLCAWGQDPHCDHEAAATIAEVLTRRLRLPLMSYPVWGWTLADTCDCPAPGQGFRLAIGQEMPLKQKAIRAHATQYGGLITDSPDGFTLPGHLLSVFERPYETFLIP